MSSKIKIILADDHQIFRDGLFFILSQINEFEVIAQASNGIELLELLPHHKPDIVLMDISMPEMDGVQATSLALSKFPKLKIIALSSYGDEIYYYKMIRAGAKGFVQKKSGQHELQKAIEAVLNGEDYFPKDILSNIIFKIGNYGENSLIDNSIQLSKREKEILLLICQGFSNNEIAEKLFISPKTVDNHRTNLLSKTGTKNAANLVMFSIKNKLIEI